MAAASGWRPVAFDECVSTVALKQKPSIPQNQYKPTGRFPVVDQGAGLVAGYTDDESAVYRDNLPLIVFGDHTRTFKFLDFPFATGADGTKLLRANEDLVDSRFLYFALLHLPLANRGYNRHFRYLREQRLLVPRDKTEQRAIAHALRAIQTAADGQAQILATLRELKAATVAKVFRWGLRGETLNETEIGEIPASWTVAAVGELCDPPQYSYTASATEARVGPKLLRITDIGEFGVNWDSVPYCDCPTHLAPKFRLHSEDLVFARIGATTGKSYLIADCPDAVFASYLIRLRTTPALRPAYLSYFFDTETYWQQVRAQKGANLKGGMSASLLARIVLPVPDLDEQKAIAANLRAIDDALGRTVRRGETLETLFSTMLHQLMTGQVRPEPHGPSHVP